MGQLLPYAQTAFNAGEISPRAQGRIDTDRYKAGLATCENCIVLPQGGLMRRPGFEYINEVKDSSKLVELIPFEFSDTQAYVLEFGDFYMRVYTDGGRVASPDSYTKLLLHCDGSDGSISFLDNGVNTHTVTPIGSAQIDTSQYEFATGSGLFDGNGDYLRIADHADWFFTTGNFTIDFWVRFDVANGIHALYAQQDGTATNFVVMYQDHELDRIFLSVRNGGTNTNLSCAWNPSINTWYHVSLIRGWGGVANSWAITVNGSAIGTFTSAIAIPDLSGYVQIGGWENSGSIIDQGTTAHSVTLANGAALSSASSKFGNGNLSFDGTNDYASIPDHANWDISTDFTISMFVKMGDHVGTETLMSQFTDATHHWSFDHIHGTGLRFEIQDGGVVVAVQGGEIADTDWHHVAMCKVGDDYGLYLDGVITAHVNDASMQTFAGSLYLAAEGSAGSQSYYGSMVEVMVTGDNYFSAAPDAGLTDSITVPTGRIAASANTRLYLPCDWMDLDGRLDEYRISSNARWTTTFVPAIQEYPGGGGSTACEIVTPYSEADVDLLRYVQSADTLYLFHPSFNTYKLTRQDHDVWSIDEIDWNEPPWNDMNTDAGKTLNNSAVSGSITVTASWSFFSPMHVGAYFYLQGGFCRITAVASATSATATVKSTMTGTGATANWKQGAWDDTQGYPTCGVFHEDRLVVAGVESNPLNVYISKVGDGNYEDFSQSSPVVDDDGLNIAIWSQTQNRIKWMQSAKRLFVGTVGAEFWVTGATVDTPIAPDSIQAKPETRIGGENIAPIMIDNAVLFVQDGGERIRLWTYQIQSDGYETADLSISSEHLTTNNQIRRMQYAQNPYSCLFCTTQNGTLLGLTIMRDQKVLGWSKITTGTADDIESEAVIPGTTQDEVWVVTKRSVNGGTKRYIERMHYDFNGDAIEDAFFVDAGLTYDGAPAVNFSGMDHLEGETVQVLADGVYIGTKTIAAGAFTLDAAASVVHAGLAYNSTVKTLPWDLSDGKGQYDANKKRIVAALLKVYETSHLRFGKDSSNLLDIPMTDGVLYTQWFYRENNGDDERNPSLTVRQDRPLPFTLLALNGDIEVGGK